jgi:hypothetical protein
MISTDTSYLEELAVWLSTVLILPPKTYDKVFQDQPKLISSFDSRLASLQNRGINLTKLRLESARSKIY